METKSGFLILAAVFLWAAQSFADTKSFITTESAKNTFKQNKSSLTPRDRIRLNEQKAKENPGLRRRWNPKSHEPASEANRSAGNLAERILSNFREDEALAKIPAKLKVSTSRGMVTLEGVVNDSAERSFIEDKVRRMDGVEKVANRLKIKTSDKDLLS